MTKGRAIPYSREELVWLEANRLLPIREYQAAFCETFGRADVEPVHLHSLRKRMEWLTGRSGRFAKGQVPANKGKPMPFHPNSAATRFRKGQLPHNTKYLGHERLSKEGYIEISIAETNPHTGFNRRYVLKHRHLWEAKHGRIPKGMCLKCIGTDKTDTDPSNWELIARAILPRLNGGPHKTKLAYDGASPELKPTILATARLQHRAKALRTSGDRA